MGKRNLKSNNFLNDCEVQKVTTSTFQEATEKIQQCDDDYECVFVHFFTADLRNNSPEECVKFCSALIDIIASHCCFAKVVLSLPFASLKDKSLNDKIMRCNVLLQYTFLNSMNVTLCDNHYLGSSGIPARKFLAKKPSFKQAGNECVCFQHEIPLEKNSLSTGWK